MAWAEARTLLDKLCQTALTASDSSARPALAEELASKVGLESLLRLLRNALEHPTHRATIDRQASTVHANGATCESRAELRRLQDALLHDRSATAVAARDAARDVHIEVLKSSQSALLRAAGCTTAAELADACRREEEHEREVRELLRGASRPPDGVDPASLPSDAERTTASGGVNGGTRLPLTPPLIAPSPSPPAPPSDVQASQSPSGPVPPHPQVLSPSLITSAVAAFDAFVADTEAARMLATAGPAAACIADPTGGLRNFDEAAAWCACPPTRRHHTHRTAPAPAPHAHAHQVRGLALFGSPREKLVAAGRALAAHQRHLAVWLRWASVSISQLGTEHSSEVEAAQRGAGIVCHHEQALQQAKDIAENAGDELQIASLKLKQACKRSSGVDEAEVEVERTRKAAEDAKRALKGARVQLYDDLRIFPELAPLVPDGLPPELLAIEAPMRTLEQYHSADGSRLLDQFLDKISADGARHPVYRASREGRQVVLKEYPVSPSSIKVCYKEVSLLLRLHHPGILEVEELFQEGDKLYLQMPFMPGGTLRTYCGATDRRPNARALCGVYFQLFQAVAHIHANDCVHRDIKPENVLMDSNGRPRLADFELSLDRASPATTVHMRCNLTTLTAPAAPPLCLRR